ncbi:MAG: TolC family protein [Thermoanaerobaculia bacterium]|nr:TolC family protein [Thermoanaerobaculia bacterium]
MTRWMVTFVLVALAAHPAAAGDIPPFDPSAPGAATLHGKLRLSIADAIKMGLENNLDVEVSRHDPPIAWEEYRAAWGVYDPELFAEGGYESRETPVASSLQANSTLVERETAGQSGLRGKVPWLNSTYSLTYIGNSLETNSSISELSPSYNVRLAAQAVFPLMRNLIWDADWTRVKQTKVTYGSSLEEFRRQVMDVVQRIESGYWDLVATDEQVRVAETSVEAARALLRQTKTQYEVGVVSRVEVTQAEAGVAEREVALIRDRNVYRTAQDNLLDLVLGRGLRPGSQLEIEPTDRPDDYIIYDIDVEEAATKAFENRPELASAKHSIERQQLEVKYRNNQRLPQLDVVGTYSVQGLSGKPNADAADFGSGNRGTLAAVNAGVIAPVNGVFSAIGAPTLAPLPVPPAPGPPLVDRSYSSADDDWFSGGAQDWGVQGIFSIPLGNRMARHRATQAQIQLRRAKTELARLQQGIILSVRRAARDLHSAQEGIEAAERARVAAEEQLRAEQIRLEQGESTPFDVLLRERDLVESESQLIGAIRVYRNSIVSLDREQGTILKSKNIVVDDVRAFR